MSARANDDGRATAEYAARWLSDQATGRGNPLHDPGLTGSTQQFGAAEMGPARVIPRVSGARVEHDIPACDSALAERGAQFLDAALALTFGDRRDDEAEAWIRETCAVPQIAAAHAYGLGYAEGADAVDQEAARDVPRLRERVAHLEVENYGLITVPHHPQVRAHLGKLIALIRKQDAENDALRARLARTLGARVMVLWAALWPGKGGKGLSGSAR